MAPFLLFFLCVNHSSLPPPVPLILPPVSLHQASGIGKRRGGSLMGSGGKKFVPAVPVFHISSQPATMKISEKTRDAHRKKEGADEFGNERTPPPSSSVRAHSTTGAPHGSVVSTLQVPPHTGGPLSSNTDFDRLFVMRCLPVQARRPRPSPDPKQQIVREVSRSTQNSTRNVTI